MLLYYIIKCCYIIQSCDAISYYHVLLYYIVPGRVVTGKSYGHGWYRVLYYREQLDITQMEVILLTEPVQNHPVLLYCVPVVVRTNLYYKYFLSNIFLQNLPPQVLVKQGTHSHCLAFSLVGVNYNFPEIVFRNWNLFCYKSNWKNWNCHLGQVQKPELTDLTFKPVFLLPSLPALNGGLEAVELKPDLRHCIYQSFECLLNTRPGIIPS